MVHEAVRTGCFGLGSISGEGGREVIYFVWLGCLVRLFDVDGSSPLCQGCSGVVGCPRRLFWSAVAWRPGRFVLGCGGAILNWTHGLDGMGVHFSYTVRCLSVCLGAGSVPRA